MTMLKQQNIPIRIYQTDNQLTLVAPLAGLEPEDINVAIDGNRVTIRGRERGPHQHDLDLFVNEWAIGPYYRDATLPQHVDGSMANATYGNGVLVITMPKANSVRKTVKTEFSLEKVEPTRGERVGHTGHEPQPTTTREHWSVAKLHQRIA
jgi:HSP20 family protein